MTPITLPGDLPGLLERGCCVMPARDFPEHDMTDGESGVVVDVGRGDSCVVRWSCSGEHPHALADLRLDLRASASRAREWLAERCGLDASGGTLWRQAMGRPGVWVLEAAFTRRDFAASVGSDVEHVVPALATIRATDPDAALLALAACCLHVAEVARG